MRKILLVTAAAWACGTSAGAQAAAGYVAPRDVAYDASKCVGGYAPPLINYDGHAGLEVKGPCVPEAVKLAAEALGMGRFRPIGLKNINGMRFTATGRLADDRGRMGAVTKMLVHMNYVGPGMRLQLEGARADGAPLKEIRVFSGGYAWNEAAMGDGATAAPTDAADQRAALLKLTPFGAMLSIVEAEGNAEVSIVKGKTVLRGTSPYDGIPVTVTLNAQNRPERAEATLKGRRYAATFAEYREEAPPYVVYFPMQMQWSVDGRPLAQLQVTEFRSNPFVALPIPAVARNPAADRKDAAFPKRKAPADIFIESVRPQGQTPRSPDGRPDLSGTWGGFPAAVGPNGRRSNELFEPDQGVAERASYAWRKPPYKPEFWGQVESLDFGTVDADPAFNCVPQGVPRQGAPTNIIQTTKEIWMYDNGLARQIPMDGRARHPDDADFDTYLGLPLGHWDGDTLVIESTGFTDNSWLGWTGYFHTNRMTVTERVRREGDVLYWDATVFDPQIFTEPYKMETQVRRLNTSPTARIVETPPCSEQDLEMMVDKYFRG
jgi:hypothetical protein